jgi:hypothetical protein
MKGFQSMRTKCGQKGGPKENQGEAAKHTTLISLYFPGGDEGI